ncbi:MAG: helix-turn-helix domain-containing protein [Ruminiclostridium sp.]|nr:helix-turn-helix domain-containing protein [Ruminiclostridium sp.]
MDIGSKIKNARIDANLTQEQSAEALGVSRQTISNWENEKTYPDIISVIKMSDLYHISLDRLLKEEPSVSDYLDYLDESTNTVKSNNKKTAVILIMTYLGIWAIALIVFWFFMDPGDALGYSIMFQLILLPVATFVISLLIGKNYCFGNLKWLSPLGFGVMYMLAYDATFNLKNAIANDRINMPFFGMLFAGAIISLLGLGIGVLVNFIQNRIKGKKKA